MGHVDVEVFNWKSTLKSRLPLTGSSYVSDSFYSQRIPIVSLSKAAGRKREIALRSYFIWNFEKSNSSYQLLLLNIADVIWEVRSQKTIQSQMWLWSSFHLGLSTFLYQMTQIRHRRMINVIAWVIAGLIDGWPLLIKSLWQIMYFASQGKEQECSSRVGRKAPRQVGAILTVPSVMCVTSKLQLLWAVLRLIPAHVKRQPLTSGELPARREIIHF